ncbi:hypothetical protein K450DRAFT_228725 [Umbelopsis ramanniana AG]|uniref:AA1-like domain-containing protein n=1 Tax=Umbelopsis ramanniana AG TaxID=1314678 RepID=A0AAD5HGX6_UMBRA|nr:uncharacterized protein K450DRAFT_228725 [Umbelopsis ramanniana AG]KAI8582031.1 hypothetical protein K450DRAFT_228725 [Umbelopsis ramanniana AG]
MLPSTIVTSLLLTIIPFVSAVPSKGDALTGTFQINHNSKLLGEAVVVRNDVANKPGSYFYFHIKEGLNPEASYADYTIELRNGHHCQHNQGSIVNYDKPVFKIDQHGGTNSWCIDKTLDITTVSMVRVRYKGEIVTCTTLEADPNFHIKHPSKVDACIRQ